MRNGYVMPTCNRDGSVKFTWKDEQPFSDLENWDDYGGVYFDGFGLTKKKKPKMKE